MSDTSAWWIALSMLLAFFVAIGIIVGFHLNAIRRARIAEAEYKRKQEARHRELAFHMMHPAKLVSPPPPPARKLRAVSAPAPRRRVDDDDGCVARRRVDDDDGCVAPVSAIVGAAALAAVASDNSSASSFNSSGGDFGGGGAQW